MAGRLRTSRTGRAAGRDRWWMVSSGLAVRTDVTMSARVHLILALVLRLAWWDSTRSARPRGSSWPACHAAAAALIALALLFRPDHVGRHRRAQRGLAFSAGPLMATLSRQAMRW